MRLCEGGFFLSVCGLESLGGLYELFAKRKCLLIGWFDRHESTLSLLLSLPTENHGFLSFCTLAAHGRPASYKPKSTARPKRVWFRAGSAGNVWRMASVPGATMKRSRRDGTMRCSREITLYGRCGEKCFASNAVIPGSWKR